uniref:ATP-dependent Clp protease proteolytic subunit n=1 Tax=Carex cinerascens TaxID=2753223 RepID=A0AAU7ALY4_9POAL
MPLGIPKVTYSRFTDDKPTWIDINERLYKERKLFLCKEITTSFANQFIGLLLLLNSESDDLNDTDIYMYINSLGGDTYQSIAIYDTMKYIVPEVSTIAIGLAASGASLILAGGTFTRRIAYPYARILIHEPRTIPTSTKKNIDSFIKETEDMLELRNIIVDIYAENTGKLVGVIQKDMERGMERDYDYFMSATEAKDYGIIDRIARLKKENE